MKPSKTLEKINREDHVNEIISRDEETAIAENSPALKMAEDLILQLAPSHEGRKEWLKTYGQSMEAKRLRNES